MYPVGPAPQWRDNRGSTKWLATAFLGCTVGSVVLIRVQQQRYLDEARNFGRVDLDTVGLQLFASLLSFGALAAVMVPTWRLAVAHRQLGRPNTRWGPGWAVGGRLIPIASAVLPILQLDELWRGSAPATAGHDDTWKSNDRIQLFSAALVFGTAGVVFGIIGTVIAFDRFFSTNGGGALWGESRALDLDSLDAGQSWLIAATVCQVVVAAFCAWVLIQISERQHRLYESTPRGLSPHMTAGLVVPNGWFPDPSGRYPLRWWDGTTWSEHVSTGYESAVDPLPTLPPEYYR